MEQQPLIPEVLNDEQTPTDSLGRPLQTPNGGGGRPHGAMSNDKKLAWRMIHDASPRILQKFIDLAENHLQTEYGFRAAEFILARGVPKPRSAPIIGLEINAGAQDRGQPSMTQLLQALNDGEITAADFAAIVRTLERSALAAPDAADTDARAQLAERLARVIDDANRRQLAAPDADAA